MTQNYLTIKCKSIALNHSEEWCSRFGAEHGKRILTPGRMPATVVGVGMVGSDLRIFYATDAEKVDGEFRVDYHPSWKTSQDFKRLDFKFIESE
ncbi:hypothetical protein HOD29_02675 [archaeon]|jgi:hypothetical protein|nr:hypothetical protein [archaeon]